MPDQGDRCGNVETAEYFVDLLGDVLDCPVGHREVAVPVAESFDDDDDDDDDDDHVEGVELPDERREVDGGAAVP